MEAAGFDRIAKAVSTGTGRRRLVAGLLGAALAAPLGRAGAQDCKRNGQACKKNRQCCSNNCAGGTGTGSTSKSAGICAAVCAHGQVADGVGGCTCAAPCVPSPGCFLRGTTEGCIVCTSTSPDCERDQTCATSADCASNAACIQGGGNPGNACGVPGANGVCVPLCST
jgi:hypothetical protein